MTIEIDHLGLSVSDYEAAKKFYTAALAPLRMTAIMEFPAEEAGGAPVVGYGADGKPFLWLSGGGPTTHVHIAIRAETRDQVDAFYAAAMAAGATDNGAPGLRPHYHAFYYGAFILDADGHNIEAVCHADPDAKPVASKRAPAKRSPAKRTAAKRASAKRTVVKKPAKKRTPAKKPARAAKAAPRRTAKPAARGRKAAARPRKGRR